jgi:hypothetical protein
MKKIFKLKPILFIVSILLLAVCMASHFSGIDLNFCGIDFGPVTGVGMAAFNLTSLTMPENMGAQDGDEDMGGFNSVGYLALRSHIATYPSLPSDPTTLEEMVTLEGNYTLNNAKYFMKLYMNSDSVSANPESQGEGVGNKSFGIKGNFMIAGFSDNVRGAARLLNNASGVLILVNEDGTRTSFGTEGRPVTFKPKGKSGSKAADSKGFECEFTTDSFVPGFTYNGEIPLDGTTLPAIS